VAKKRSSPSQAQRRSKPAGAVVPAWDVDRTQLAGASCSGDGSVVREKDVTMVVGQPYAMGARSIVADAAYYVGAGRAGREARLGGADKGARRDPATGYECIIMRDEPRGHLSGYVAVPTDHPLHGFDHDAIPVEFDIEVHGGLTYSAVCDEGPNPRRVLIREARRICHVAPPRYATGYRAGHDQAWWLGFSCDHVYDIVPLDRDDRSRFLGHETGATFRDEAYVYDQVVDLAAQLRAIADGAPKPVRTGVAPPPLGLDPKRAG